MRRWLIALVAVVSTAAALSVATPGWSASTTVEIVSPAYDEVVRGDATVTFIATPLPGTTLRAAKLVLPDAAAGMTTHWVPLTGCDVTLPCRLDYVLSTEEIANGTTTIQVNVHHSSSAITFWSTRVVVDNPKPVAVISSPADGARVWDSAVVTVDARASDRPDGRPVHEVRFYISSSFIPRPDGTFTWGLLMGTDTTAPYTSLLSIAATPAIRYVTAVAFDDLGNHSAPSTVRLIGHPGLSVVLEFGLYAPPPSGYEREHPVVPADSLQVHWFAAEPAATYPPATTSTPPDWLITGAELTIDGQPADRWESGTCPSCFRAAPGMSGGGTYPIAGAGPHTVTVTVWDNKGVVDTTTMMVDVDAGVAFGQIVWQEDGAAAVPLTEGARVRLSPTSVRGKLLVPVQVINRHARLRSARVDVDGVTVTEVDECADPLRGYDPCPSARTYAAGWQATTAGPHTIRITIGTRAAETVLTRSITAVPGARPLTSLTSASIVAGGRTTAGVRLVRFDTGQPLSGRQVALQWLRNGASTWTTVAARTTDANGRASAAVTPPSGGLYRWSVATTPDMVGAVSANVRVTVRVRMTISLSRRTAARGRTVRVSATATPPEYHAAMTLQRYVRGRGWTNVAAGRQSSAGTVAFRVRLPKGTHPIRIVKTTTTRYATSTSPTANLRVR